MQRTVSVRAVPLALLLAALPAAAQTPAASGYLTPPAPIAQILDAQPTPGVLVAAKALLERNVDPTEEETRYWLAGNLCRCTGYDKIIRAVLDTAAELRQERLPA